jgi:monoamine oxidase
VGSEFAKQEAGYLEGAINAVDSALANLIDA